MLIRGSELKGMLSRARVKRQKLNHSQMFLFDMESRTGSSVYGDSLQELLSVKLAIGRKSMTIPENREIEAQSDIVLDPVSVDDVTLDISDRSVDEIEQRRDSGSEYDAFVRDVRERLETELVENGEKAISWESYSYSNDRRTAALNFHHLLESAFKRDFAVSQDRPYGDIYISLPM